MGILESSAAQVRSNVVFTGRGGLLWDRMAMVHTLSSSFAALKYWESASTFTLVLLVPSKVFMSWANCFIPLPIFPVRWH